MKLTRKEFFVSTVATLGAAAFGIGCGDSGSGGAGGGSGGESAGGNGTGGNGTGGQATGGNGTGGEGTGGAPPAGCSETISVNHGHTLVVSDADVTAGVEKTYDIMGSSIHTHSVTITAADFTTLQGGGMITVMSTATDHSHSITVSCA